MKKKIITGLLVAGLVAGCATTSGPSTDSSNRAAVKVTQTAKGVLISSDERILFDTGKSDIKPDGKILLERVAKVLKEKTKANVSIEGHTDNVGSQASNQQLSERRANAVRSRLIQQGVDAKRLTAKGLGFGQPVADNATPEGRQSNRRTDILVLGETVENIGGNSLADRLQEGLTNFLKNAGEVMQSVFGK